MKIRFKFAILFLLGISNFVVAQEVWTIGPMVHINFGQKKIKTSFAIEAAYWNYNKFFHSVDGGIEFERKKIRFYSELQTGLVFAGISCGPVMEINKEDHKAYAGIQGSIWGNYFLGFDYRMRWVNKNRYISPGCYVKIPVATTGTGSNNNGSSHDYDWD